MRILCLAAVILLAGCAVAPGYRRPELGLPASFTAEPAEEKSIAELPWWEMYQDPTLQQLLKAALAQNRDVKIAAARVEEARALVGVSRVAQLPQVDLDLNGTRGRLFQSEIFATGSVYSAQAQASYEVDLWRRLASLTDEARANLLASEYGRAAVRTGLIADVTSAYFSLLALDQQLAITQRTIATRERFSKLTQSRFRHGATSSLDVNRADASLAAARSGLYDLQLQATQVENQLQILLGQYPAPVARPRLDLQALPMPVTIPAGLPSSLLERRPDVRQAEFNLAASTADLQATKAALFPKISLTGSFGSASTEFSRLFTGPTKIWTFGIDFLQPLIDAQRNGYQVDAAQARVQQATLQYQNVVVQSFREVSDALAARRSYAESLITLGQQVTSLRQASASVLRRYEVGYSSYFEVIDADSSLFAAELLLVQAYRNNLLALVQLYRSLGGGWNDVPLGK